MQKQCISHNIASKIFKTIKLLWEASSWEFIGVLVANACTGLLTPISLYCSQRSLDSIVLCLEGQERIPYSIFWLIISLMLMLFGNTISLLLQGKKALLSEKIELHITNKIITKCNELSLEEYENPETVNKIKISLQEASNRCSILIDITSDMAKSFISVMGVASIILEFNSLLLVVVFICMYPILKIRSKSSEKLYQISAEQIPNQRMKDTLINLLLNTKNIAEFKIFDTIPYVKKRICDVMYIQYSANRTMRRQTGFVNIGSMLINILCTLVVKIWALSEALFKKYTVGEISKLLGSIDALRGQIQSIFFCLSMFYEQLLYVNALYELLGSSNHADEKRRSIDEQIRKVDLENVSFTYKGANSPALKHIDLHLEAGKIYAIVGKNGSGKSTLVKLIMGLYSPCDGNVLLNGKNIGQWNHAALCNQISAVFQEYIRYPFSVKDNIGIGWTSCENLTDIKIAAERSFADDFIEALPDKYETQLYKEWKGGVELSGGQWQRLAIARCLLRNPSVQVLDEACASIDNATKAEIQKSLLVDKDKKITILISHEKKEIENCDWIIILENGQVVTQGKYKEIKDDASFTKIFKFPDEKEHEKCL